MKGINEIDRDALYRSGNEECFAKYWSDDYEDYNEQCKAYEEAMEEAAWRAYYNDNYLIDSIAEGYFLIGEVYGLELADRYLTEHEVA